MSLAAWLRSGKRHGSTREHPTFRPTLESLEDRCVPSTLKPSTLTVVNLNDSGPGSLRYEIAQAQSNDTIGFDKSLNNAKITLTSGELVIDKNLTIQGPRYGLTITSQPWVDGAFDTHNGSRIFEVDGANTTVAIIGLRMTDGGGTRLGGGFIGYANDGYGGAVLNFGRLTLSGSTLGGSTAATNYAQYGGAIANFGAMTVTGCDVSGNQAITGFGADEGGGIYNAGSLTVSGGDVSSNYAGDFGGGIYNVGTATVSGCTLSGDIASQGGGIYNGGTAAALTVLDSIFSSNSPDNIYGPYTDGGGNTFK